MSAERDFSSRRRARRPGRDDLLLLVLGVALLAASGAAAGSAWADLRHARASLAEARRAKTDAEARAKTLSGDGGPADVLGARAVWTLEAPPPRVVAAVAQALPPDVRLESLALRYGGALDVEMTVTARTPQAYGQFLDALTRSGAFSGVVPGDETRGALVQASVRARYEGSAP